MNFTKCKLHGQIIKHIYVFFFYLKCKKIPGLKQTMKFLQNRTNKMAEIGRKSSHPEKCTNVFY